MAADLNELKGMIDHLHNHFANSAAIVGHLATSYLDIDWSFTASNVIEAGGVFRLIETGYTPLSNEVSTGGNICDNPSSDSWAVLCYGGACDHTTTCSRVIDFAVREDAGATGMPTCVTFNPAPISTTGRATGQTDTRTGFTSSGTTFQQADWGVAAMSRD